MHFEEENHWDDEGRELFSECCSYCNKGPIVEDFERGCSVCLACGCCGEIVYMDDRKLIDYDERPIAVEKYAPERAAKSIVKRQAFAVVHGKKQGYKPDTYFNEKIAQWRGLEPRIPDSDRKAIATAWLKRLDADPELICDKAVIRDVLLDCDRELLAAKYTPYFVKKYLEKWLTIREMLDLKESMGVFVPESAVHDLRRLFAQIKVPVETKIKGVNGRRSFPNYNFVFRRLLELIGLRDAVVDFPPLKTKPKRHNLEAMWRVICAENGWPYINTDAEHFLL